MSGRQINRARPDGRRHGNYTSHTPSFTNKIGITCVVCCHLIPGEHRRPIFAIGPCDHPVCYHCSAKMRVLCKQNECPICRQEISEVIFTEDYRKKYNDFGDKHRLHFNDKFKIYFETQSCLDTFNSLLEEKCKKCKTPLSSVHELQDHLWEKHRLLTCELCIRNLKIFSEERKYYNAGQLDAHMKNGDPDDRSYQGHPACQLCTQRYVDSEELNRHLRREHFYCHLCDPSKIVYYNKYETLNQHFREEHFLCEEGDCKTEQFTSVFQTVVDLQAHRASVHCLTKSEAKHARTLSLDLTFNPTSRGPRSGLFNPSVMASFAEDNSRSSGRGRGRGDRGDRGGDRNREQPTIPEDVWMTDDVANLGAAAMPIQLLPRPEDFPVLGEPSNQGPPIPTRSDPMVPTSASRTASNNAPSSENLPNSKKPKHKFSTKVKESATFGRKDDEEFPALCQGGTSSAASATRSVANSSSLNAISLAEAVKLSTKPPEKPTSQPSQNVKPPKPPKSTSSNNRTVAYDMNGNDEPSSSQDFSLTQNDFPSLPFKVNGNRKKKKSLNILLASLNNPQPNPPPNYTSVRLVDSLNSKENNASTVKDNENDAGPSLEANMESLLLEEDNFPPLSGVPSNSKTKQPKVNKKDPPLTKSRPSKSSAQSSSLSSNTNQTSFSSVARPSSDEKRNSNKTNANELSMEAVAQQVIKPKSSNISSSSKSNHVNNRTKVTNSVNHQQVGPSETQATNCKTNDLGKSASQSSSPQNQRKTKKENSVSPDDQSESSKQTLPMKLVNQATNKSQNGSIRSSQNSYEPTEYSYIYPKDFDERNRRLFDMIQATLKDRFRDFDQISKAFFNDDIPPHHYYNKCVEMFRNKLNHILLDLIVLLPDIRKQKHLLAAHEANVKQRRGVIPKKTGVWEIKTDSDLDVVVCPMCGQVLSKRDGPDHITTHQKIKS